LGEFEEFCEGRNGAGILFAQWGIMSYIEVKPVLQVWLRRLNPGKFSVMMQPNESNRNTRTNIPFI